MYSTSASGRLLVDMLFAFNALWIARPLLCTSVTHLLCSSSLFLFLYV